MRSLNKAPMKPPAVKLLLKIQKHSSCEKLIASRIEIFCGTIFFQEYETDKT